MKKEVKIAIIIMGILLCLPKRVEATPANPAFKDDNFYQCVIDKFSESESGAMIDTNLTDEQLANIVELDCKNRGIQDVSGIEKLVNLAGISLSNNDISSIDLTHNSKLSWLEFQNNHLSSIDLSHNLQLIDLYLGSNQLEEIDLSKNVKLRTLNISSNKLKAIDVSNNVELTGVDLSHNKIRKIDLSKNVKLVRLNLAANSSIQFDLSNNVELTTLDIDASWVDHLDLSHNTKLETLQCQNNNLKTLDLTHNPKLTTLFVGTGSLEQLDLSDNSILKHFAFYSNRLLSLDIKGLDLSQSGDLNPQKRTLEVYRKGKKFVLPLKSYDKKLDPSKVELTPQEGVKYDSKTGLILLDTFVDNVQYTYHSSEKFSFSVLLTLQDGGKEYPKEIEPSKPDDDKTDVIEVPATGMRQNVALILIAVFVLLIGTGIFYLQLGRKQGKKRD